eukprot:TRINITY_DN15207_c0_g2_i1.p1 TRINITY_DN15207_c0_g2~~TRINITY_DN15207_c0_g2_i1.p1  ORF type:complete len:836 (-),score=113.83 TRINITY_DN15207_c0_g2_i1:245-2752(-)
MVNAHLLLAFFTLSICWSSVSSATCKSDAEVVRYASASPVLLSVKTRLLKRGVLWSNGTASDADHPKKSTNLAKSIDKKLRDMGHGVAKSMGLRNEKSESPKKIMGAYSNGKADVLQLITALAIGVGGSITLIFIFSFLRMMVPAVYHRRDTAIGREMPSPAQFAQDLPEEVESEAAMSPREEQTLFPDPHVGFKDWLWKIWHVTPDEEVSACGLDGWAFLEFIRLNRRILGVIAPVLAIVLGPLHYSAAAAKDQLDLVSHFDIGQAPLDSVALWVHGFVVWFVVLASAWQITVAQDHFTERRHEWLKEVPLPRATTVLVENIPPLFRSDHALRNYFVSVFSSEAVKRAYIVRKTGHLPAQVQQLEDARQEADAAMKVWEAADRPGIEQAEGAEHKRCQKRLRQLAKEVQQSQEKIEDAVQRGDPAVSSATGFVTFASELAKRLASREQYTREVEEFKMKMPPDPDDVIYENLAEDRMGSLTWSWLGFMAILSVFIFWTPVVVFISGWTTAEQLVKFVPWLAHMVKDYPSVATMASALLATVALKVFMAVLPAILYWIVMSFFSVKSKSAVQLKLQEWYFAFLLIFVLLVTTLGRGLTITAVIIAHSPSKIFDLLASYLPSASHFYFSYLILAWPFLMVQVCRPANVVYYLFNRYALGMDVNDAKDKAEPEDPASYGMGTRMASVMLFSAMGFVFCSCSPLILLFSGVYFSLASMVFTYLLVFAETKKPDTGGLMWMQALNQLFLVLLLYIFLMTGVLHMLDPHQSEGPAILAFTSILGLYWAKHRVDGLAFDILPLEEVVRASRAREEKRHQQVQGFYGQPECNPSLALLDGES